MARCILHVDLNNFYASVECLYRPELATKPVAVSGDIEVRQGIVLARNQPAKQYGVTISEAIWQTKAKCSNLMLVPPDFNVFHGRRVKFTAITRTKT